MAATSHKGAGCGCFRYSRGHSGVDIPQVSSPKRKNSMGSTISTTDSAAAADIIPQFPSECSVNDSGVLPPTPEGGALGPIFRSTYSDDEAGTAQPPVRRETTAHVRARERFQRAVLRIGYVNSFKSQPSRGEEAVGAMSSTSEAGRSSRSQRSWSAKRTPRGGPTISRKMTSTETDLSDTVIHMGSFVNECLDSFVVRVPETEPHYTENYATATMEKLQIALEDLSESGVLYRYIKEAQKAESIEQSPWETRGDTQKTQVLRSTFRMPVSKNIPEKVKKLLPERGVEGGNVTLMGTSDEGIVVMGRTKWRGVPCSERMRVQTITVFSPQPDGVLCRMWVETLWVDRLPVGYRWLEGIIARTVQQKVVSKAPMFGEALQDVIKRLRSQEGVLKIDQ